MELRMNVTASVTCKDCIQSMQKIAYFILNGSYTHETNSMYARYSDIIHMCRSHCRLLQNPLYNE